jgi:hypothetical protein
LDSAESEKGELMNKLKKSTKKAVWEGITRQGLETSELGDGDSSGPSLPNPVKVIKPCFMMNSGQTFYFNGIF